MALAQDIVTQIVNVQWGGLAVEFTQRPSYLTLSNALSMNKVTISFWFRIPQQAVDAVAARDDARIFFDFPILDHCVPLLMFGQQQSGQLYDFGGQIGEFPSQDPGTGAPIMVPVYGNIITDSHSAPMQSSCIGVQFRPGEPEGQLNIHIQTADHATATNLLVEEYAIELTEGFYNVLTRDATYTVVAVPEYLGNIDTGSGPAVKVDKWHHILVSWDLRTNSTHGSEHGTTTSEGTGAYSLMWCAIDDVNKNKYDLPARWIGGLGYGSEEDLSANPNGHLSAVAWHYAGSPERYGPASVNVSFSTIPAGPLIVPAPPTLNYASGPSGQSRSINANQLVEMAELQIFTGVTLDTSIAEKRRAFIDFKRDADGNPIMDKDGKRTLKPVDPKQAEELFGKKPDILLHGTIEWQEGKNTGSLGIDGDGNEIPTGQFEPTGKIEKYPDPEIIEA